MIESKTQLFDRENARKLLESNYQGNRNFKKKHAEYLAGEMTIGRFSPTAVIAIGILNGVPHLINGQHTLSAIDISNTAHRLTVQSHTVSTDQQLAELYSRYDISMGRKFADSVGAFGISHTTGLSVLQLNRLSSAIRWMMGGQKASNNRISNEDMIEQCVKWHKSAKMFFKSCSGIENSIRGTFQSAPVLTMGIITFKYRPETASEFWEQVSLDDGLNIGDPRKTLNKYFYRNRLRESNSKSVVVVSKRHMFYACSRSWKKYCNSESLRLIKQLTDNDRFIAGTPYDGTYESVS